MPLTHGDIEGFLHSQIAKMGHPAHAGRREALAHIVEHNRQRMLHKITEDTEQHSKEHNDALAAAAPDNGPTDDSAADSAGPPEAGSSEEAKGAPALTIVIVGHPAAKGRLPK
ncbi:MAG TPA: hypothetical protein VNL17_14395 [Verrucomicrobiae bacterium]|nr:hypothetical protein [Verrucomicrobiae bacterium]